MALDTAPFLKIIGQIARRRRSARDRHARFDLKTMLMLRIGFSAIVSFFLMTWVTIFEIEHQERMRVDHTATLVSKHLELQLLRIQTGFDSAKRYPDLEGVLSSIPPGGDCVTVVDRNGKMEQSECSGSTFFAPSWFASSLSLVFPNYPAIREITFKNASYGEVIVEPNVADTIGRVWLDLRALVVETAVTTLVAALLVYIAIARALAPTDTLVAGLNKMSNGEFSYRLPRYHLSELHRIAIVANELAERIEQSLCQRAQLTTRLLNVQEEERRLLASELHDEYGQNLTAIAALSTSIESATELSTSREEAAAIQTIAENMMQSLRGTLLRLRPAEIERFGLSEALRRLVDFWNVCGGPKTQFVFRQKGEVDCLRGNVALHIFRLAQEGLTNAARHANASAVELTLDVSSTNGIVSRAHLSIGDNGDGGLKNRQDLVPGTGLTTMQERVAALGGTLAWSRRANAGVLVDIAIPIVREA